MIICNRERFRREGGREIGASGWVRSSIRILSKELEDEVIHYNLHKIIKDSNFEKLNIEGLRKIKDIINSQIKPKTK